MEEWKKIEGYENYSISKYGKVRNYNGEKLVWRYSEDYFEGKD